MDAIHTDDPRSALTHGAIERMVRVMRAQRRVIDRRIDGLGIHQGQHRLLMGLSRTGRSASQKDIAQELDVSPACVARTLKFLSAEGLIEKSEGEDSRFREIDILPKGQRLIDDSIRIFRETDAMMFEGITDDEIEALTRTLEKMRRNLSDMEDRKE